MDSSQGHAAHESSGLLSETPPPYQNYDCGQRDTTATQAHDQAGAAPPEYCHEKQPITAEQHNNTLRTSSADQDWEFHYGWGSYSYWTRQIRWYNEFHHQYGISRDSETSSDEEPDFFFTCHMQARREGCDAQIRRWCAVVAQHMRHHRGLKYDKCSCTFENLRDSQHGCTRKTFRPRRIMTGKTIKSAMKKHDALCACNCFGPQKYVLGSAGWKFWPNHRFAVAAYWSRKLEPGNDIWIQCGISRHYKKRDRDDGPDVFFTCKLNLRDAETPRHKIAHECQCAARSLRLHRGRSYDECSCSFENLQTCRQHGLGGFWAALTANMVRSSIEAHDKLCSCGCFDKALALE